MDIAILGAGKVGGALGRNFARAGHTVHYARRDPSAPVPERLDHDGATVGGLSEALARSDAVLLATPWKVTQAVLAEVEDFGERPLLDATNPFSRPALELTVGHTDSGGERVQRWAPTARVVKVFNQTGVENMIEPRYDGVPSLMLACGDDEEAVLLAVRLATEIGFDAYAFGPLRNARLLEPLAGVWIRLAMMHGLGRRFGFGVMKR